MRFSDKPWYRRWPIDIKFFFHRLRYRLFHRRWLVNISFGENVHWDYGDIARLVNGIHILYLGNQVWKKLPPS